MARFFFVSRVFVILFIPGMALSQGSPGKPVNVPTVADSSLSLTDSLQKKIVELEKANRLLNAELESQKKITNQNLQISNKNQQELIKLRMDLDECKRQTGFSQSLSERQKNEAGRQQDLLKQELNQARKQQAEAEKYKTETEKKIQDLQKEIDELKKSQPADH